MRTFLKFCLVSTMLVHSVSFEARGEESDDSFSQLDFDREVRKRLVTETVDVRSDIGARPRLDTPATPKAVPAQAPSSVKSSQSVSKVPTASGTLITPRLKGPWVDKGNKKTISSRRTWKWNSHGRCGNPRGKLALCNKARAVRELLYRFSGTDDYANAQCSISCADPNESGALVGLSLASTSGGQFRFVRKGESCRYQLQKPSQGGWKVLRPAKTHCACLPKKCIAEQ